MTVYLLTSTRRLTTNCWLSYFLYVISLSTAFFVCAEFLSHVLSESSKYYDDAHYTDRGARTVAMVVSEYFRQREPFLSSDTHDTRKELN